MTRTVRQIFVVLRKELTDSLRDSRFVWRGKVQRISLSPEMPYAIWRVRPRGEA